MKTTSVLAGFFLCLAAAVASLSFAEDTLPDSTGKDAETDAAVPASALPGVPSGTTTPFIPAITTPDGTQFGVSANIDNTGPNPIINGGGIGVSTPVNESASVGAGVSRTPAGSSLGVGVSISF